MVTASLSKSQSRAAKFSYCQGGNQGVNVPLGVEEVRSNADASLTKAHDDAGLAERIEKGCGFLRRASREASVRPAPRRIRGAGRGTPVLRQAVEHLLHQFP